MAADVPGSGAGEGVDWNRLCNLLDEMCAELACTPTTGKDSNRRGISRRTPSIGLRVRR